MSVSGIFRTPASPDVHVSGAGPERPSVRPSSTAARPTDVVDGRQWSYCQRVTTSDVLPPPTRTSQPAARPAGGTLVAAWRPGQLPWRTIVTTVRCEVVETAAAAHPVNVVAAAAVTASRRGHDARRSHAQPQRAYTSTAVSHVVFVLTEYSVICFDDRFTRVQICRRQLLGTGARAPTPDFQKFNFLVHFRAA